MCEEDGVILLRLPLEECVSTFNLEKAVCNHGFFMMAPNVWIPSTKTLQRPLQLADDHVSVTVSISHPLHCNFLLVKVLHHTSSFLSSHDQQVILEQVARMLRISHTDEKNIREFHKVHAEAKEKGFGRIFRSPTLFEDMIKSMLLCNCTWDRTLKMAKALCELQSELATLEMEPKLSDEKVSSKRLKRRQAISNSHSNKRARKNNSLLVRSSGNFPNAREIANLEEGLLKERCNVGYRASNIIELAKNIVRGRLKLTTFELLEEEEKETNVNIVYDKLLKIKGLGPFASANILMCLGFYQIVPVDSETIRHFKQVHGREASNTRTIHEDIKETYGKYSPFSCLAYWLELLDYYEKRFGKLSNLSPSCYHSITGSLKQCNM